MRAEPALLGQSKFGIKGFVTIHARVSTAWMLRLRPANDYREQLAAAPRDSPLLKRGGIPLGVRARTGHPPLLLVLRAVGRARVADRPPGARRRRGLQHPRCRRTDRVL